MLKVLLLMFKNNFDKNYIIKIVQIYYIHQLKLIIDAFIILLQENTNHGL